MFHLMLQKILHKKWMAISLLIGNILLVSIAVSHPMYQEASRKRMLTDEFVNYIHDNNAYPMIMDTQGLIRKEAGISDTERIRNFANTVAEKFDIPEIEKICVRGLVTAAATPVSLYNKEAMDPQLILGTMYGLPEHAKMVSGRIYSDTFTDDGYIEAVVSQSAMVDNNLLVGEELHLNTVRFAGGDIVKISKPNPEIYLLTCKELMIKPEEAYAIEDSFNGIRAAHAANMHPVMVPDMIPADSEMFKLSEVVCNDLFEVIDYFSSVNPDL